METTAVFLHFVNFLMPAWVVAALLAPSVVWGQTGGRGRHGVRSQRSSRGRAGYTRQPGRLHQMARAWLWLGAMGSVVLAGGLVAFGHDGRMVTYGLLVVVLGTAVAVWRSRA